MKLSMKTDYALRVLGTLVEHHGQGPIPIRELARRNEVPKPFLEHIMLELKEQGWVESRAGSRGGYVLARRPENRDKGSQRNSHDIGSEDQDEDLEEQAEDIGQKLGKGSVHPRCRPGCR